MKFEDIIEACIEKKENAYEQAQAIIQTQEKEILRLGALYNEVAQGAKMFKDTLAKLCNYILDHPKRDFGRTAEELLAWLAAREE